MNSAPETHRLFFALWPTDAAREALHRVADDVEAAHPSGGRATNRARYHVTLQFLGDYRGWPEELHRAACEAAAAVHTPAFELVFDQAGSFGASRVWWLGCSAVPPAMTALWGHLGRELAARGVHPKGHPQFTPHLTIRRGARKRLALSRVEPVDWRVDRFVLVDSQSGLGYRQLAAWPLDG